MARRRASIGRSPRTFPRSNSPPLDPHDMNDAGPESMRADERPADEPVGTPPAAEPVCRDGGFTRWRGCGRRHAGRHRGDRPRPADPGGCAAEIRRRGRECAEGAGGPGAGRIGGAEIEPRCRSSQRQPAVHPHHRAGRAHGAHPGRAGRQAHQGGRIARARAPRRGGASRGDRLDRAATAPSRACSTAGFCATSTAAPPTSRAAWASSKSTRAT